MLTKVKTAKEIKAMRIAGKALGTILNELEKEIKVGMSTLDVAKLTRKKIKQMGVKPAFLGYQGFPDVICISIDEEIVHGIPKADKIIENGAVVKLDLGIKHEGMIVDGAITTIVGEAGKEVRDLSDRTKQSLHEGLKAVKAGRSVGDIGYAIEKYANQFNYGIIRDLVGHGVGHEVHEDPNIPNYGKKNSGMELQAGMTIAIEPMLTLGSEDVAVLPDGWTIITRDASIGCQFEHTVLVTDKGCEILTQA
ncbi:MAG: type I methionyl aminopeptidase [Patescibacteria group bacterium]